MIPINLLRRRGLLLAAVSLASAFSLTLPTSAPAAETLVVAHAAGINGQAVDKLVAQFATETGVAATGLTMSDTDYGAKMQLVARTHNPGFDVALGVPTDVYQLTQSAGIFAAIDTGGWNSQTLAAMKDAGLIGQFDVVSQDTAALLVYGEKLFANPPRTWADFFDVAKFPGNRGMASGGLGVPINLEYALVASGKPAPALYPLDLDAAMAKIGALGTQIVLWDNAPKGIQDVLNGDTTMTWAYGPAALGAVSAGQKVRLAAPEGTAVSRQVAVILKDAPNGAATGQRFLEWWFRPDVQARYTELTNYGIVVPSKAVLARFTPEQSQFMPFSGPDPKAFHILDYGYYAAKAGNGQSNLANVLSRWSKFRAQ